MNNDYNIILVNGDDLFLSVTIQDRDEVIVDVTGYTFNLKVKEKYTDTTDVLNVVGVADNPTSWVVEFSSETSTLDLTIGNYVYDIEMIDTEDKKTTVLRGYFTVKNNVN